MEIRSDINARTAMVYAGAAFLLVIVGFKSIVATIESWSDVGILTYLSIFALVLEFALLILYAQSIYSLGPSGGGSEKSGSEVAATVSNMDKGAASSLAGAIDGLKDKDDLQLVEMLIASGANVDFINENDVSPIRVAIFCSNKYVSATQEVIEILIKAGANVNIKHKDSHTPLHLASMALNDKSEIIIA